MTDAQEDAIAKVKEILSEHFDACVMVVQVEEGDKAESNPAFWHGGWALAVGLLEVGKISVLNNRKEEV